LPLGGERPLIWDTLQRARLLAPDERIRILTGSHLREAFQNTMADLDESCYLVEPQARGTGPALTWAVWTIAQEDPAAVIISLHADHIIPPPEAFRDLLRWGAELARDSEGLVTVSVPPSRAETGFGYIEPGDTLREEGSHSAFEVLSFVEKPDRAAAERYVDSGFNWNSGIFLWTASAFLSQITEVAPELSGLLPLLEAGDTEGFFEAAPVVSVDEALLQRSSQVSSVRATFQWEDVGSWEALSQTREMNPVGNVLFGSVHTLDSSGNLAFVEEGDFVLFGVDDLLVARSGDTVLVADRARSSELETLLEGLPQRLRDPDPK
jgi:mannose-1-phosphate guanylyltransferase